MTKPTVADNKPVRVELENGAAYLCACKQTANAPFCDGKHTTV